MKRINVLDIETSNKIAAGEVVEKPASVVKELVENSIDSKAKSIAVEILDGGQSSIKVIDDGVGLHPEDIEKAFMPHATSKITSIEDIYSINTMGFRGEALASIAAVSNITLKSRIESFDYGREISISGGKINCMQDIGSNIGTTIEVKDLFFNVPARQKFLKSSSREAANISDILNRLALANPEVSFKFISNNKKILNTYGTGKLIDTMRSIYGKTICDNITSFEKYTDEASVHGYIGNSEISRGSRNNQSIFVNKRYIKSKLITAAVENAFKSFLTVNKYPFFVLFLDIYPELIDVNVHPTKSEIKFKDDKAIFKLAFQAVHDALRGSLRDSFNIPYDDINNLPRISDLSGSEKLTSTSNDTVENTAKDQLIQLPIDLKSFHENNYKNEDNGNNKNYDCNLNEKFNIENYRYDNANRVRLYTETYEGNNAPVYEVSNENDSFKSNDIEYNDQNNLSTNNKELVAKFPPLNIIGQFNSTYVLAEAMSNLYIIDQHAAHEKILFEKYSKSIKEESCVSQVLITPVIAELTAEDYSYYIENSNIFSKAGFNIDLFGDNTISVREVPMILGKPDVKNLFMDILDNLKNMGSGETHEVKYSKIAKLACKSAVKAKDSLSIIEMKSLVEELRYIDDPFTCPHGRPTIVKITLSELEKKFKRIQ